MKLYFVQAAAGGPIKIGVSKNPRKRLAQLQTASPIDLVLRRVVDDPNAWGWERRLHELFAEWRMRGEWFQAHPTVANVADALSSNTFAEDAIPLREDPILFVDATPTEPSDAFLGRVRGSAYSDDAYFARLRANPDNGYVPAGSFAQEPLTSSHRRLRTFP